MPGLIPSALGTALNRYVGTNKPRYLSSSSTSSTSCSGLSEDEDDSKHLLQCDSDQPIDPNCLSVHSQYPVYARRPSGINNRSTVGHFQPRQTSTSCPKYTPGGLRNATIRSSADEEDAYSDIGFSSADGLETDEHDLALSEKGWGAAETAQPGSASQRNRNNRASLPAYFSLLQAKSPSKEFRPSPVSSSSGTIARPSPPTPKLVLSNRQSQAEITAAARPTVLVTPRGRRREADKSHSSRRSGRSSPSRSRSRRHARAESPDCSREAYLLSRGVTEDIPQVAPPRGRATTRRNSSPTPQVFMGAVDPSILACELDACLPERSPSGSRSRPRTRGRARIEELGGRGFSRDAPGYGNGRSGLVDRGRAMSSHLTRVPL